MTDDSGADYSRGHDAGVIAGEIAARLAGHDRHFASINGSLSDVARELHDMTLAVQRLGDQAAANSTTVLATAKALKEADEARRNQTEQHWSPVQKTITVVLAAVAVVGLVLAVWPR